MLAEEEDEEEEVELSRKVRWGGLLSTTIWEPADWCEGSRSNSTVPMSTSMPLLSSVREIAAEFVLFEDGDVDC